MAICCLKMLHTVQSTLQQKTLSFALVFLARRSEHITPPLRELHWLKVPERIRFRLCVLTHRCLHGAAPPYLAEILQSAADVQGCRRLQSASTSTLVVPPTRRATIGDRAFPGAASRAWNSLSTSVREIQSLPAFRRKLKTALFAISFPADRDII